MPKLTDYIAIKGVSLRKVDLANWSESNFLAFFSIVNELTEGEAGKEIVKVTEAKLKVLEDRIFNEHDPGKAEVIYRIDQMTKEPTSTPRKFYGKLSAMMRTIGHYIKENPSTVTDDIFNLIKDNPRLNWMLRNYKNVVTPLGEITVADQGDTTSFIPQKTNNANPQVKLMEAQIYVADLYYQIAKSIKAKDLKKMTAKEKIDALAKLGSIIKDSGKSKANVGIFNQINLHKANKEDVEEALLNFAKTK